MASTVEKMIIKALAGDDMALRYLGVKDMVFPDKRTKGFTEKALSGNFYHFAMMFVAANKLQLRSLRKAHRHTFCG